MISWLMYVGVRIGGSSHYATTFRWGYGWNYQRPNEPLSNSEKALVKTLFPTKEEIENPKIESPGLFASFPGNLLSPAVDKISMFLEKKWGKKISIKSVVKFRSAQKAGLIHIGLKPMSVRAGLF